MHFGSFFLKEFGFCPPGRLEDHHFLRVTTSISRVFDCTWGTDGKLQCAWVQAPPYHCEQQV